MQGQAPSTGGLTRFAARADETGLSATGEQEANEVRPTRGEGDGPPPFFPTGPTPYRYLRYEEDFTYLRDPTRRTDPWDPFKFISLDPAGNAYLTLGGETWQRFEGYHNPLLGQAPTNREGASNVYLQRYLLHGDFHLGETVRVFGQFKSGLENDRVGGPRPFDEDRADVGQLFLDLARPFGRDGTLTVRTGRQEMAYGGLRLVDIRDGTNVHLAFDGVRTIIERGDRRLDAFLTKPVETNPGTFDDRPDPNQTFWGLYGVRPLAVLPDGHLDYYYLGLRRNHAQFVQGTARETRHTLGTRWWGNPGSWDYNAEFAFQFGTFGDVPISAGIATADAGYTWGLLPGKPRLGLSTVAASGGRGAGAKVLESYNPLFPTGAYFNRVPDLLGPTNTLAVHPKLTVFPTPKVRMIADWAFFGRTSLDDGIYGLISNVIRPPEGNRSRFVGSALSGEVQWQVNTHLAVVGAYTHIYAGPFLRQTGPHSDEDAVIAFFDYRF